MDKDRWQTKIPCDIASQVSGFTKRRQLPNTNQESLSRDSPCPLTQAVTCEDLLDPTYFSETQSLWPDIRDTSRSRWFIGEASLMFQAVPTTTTSTWTSECGIPISYNGAITEGEDCVECLTQILIYCRK